MRIILITAALVLQMIDSVNTSFQQRYSALERSFWDVAAYHTGNMEAYFLTKNPAISGLLYKVGRLQ